jgi:hypothetical protein
MCPTTGLIRIATGRDASDVAFATIFGKVMWTMPKVRIQAIEDAAAGVELPVRTDLAISTAGPLETSRALPDAPPANNVASKSWYKPPLPIHTSFSAPPGAR